MVTADLNLKNFGKTSCHDDVPFLLLEEVEGEMISLRVFGISLSSDFICSI